ncbi:MAG: hypothetical protein IPN70_00855 [Candidatus Moraniibacteriota bacterium]|nr:MAG: hypothetical protein IPN70_00855 [Candidatus Moranbacteria bacterium]
MINKYSKPIVVMMAYARSGGTLLNRCIASIPNTFVLSEVSIEALCPSSCSTIKEQSKEWYGLELKSEGFIENITEIYEYCISKNLTLVVRDWTFGSFVPSRYNNFKPSKSLATLDALFKFFPVIPIAFVRNAIDVWLSLNASPRTFYDKNLDFLYELTTSLVGKEVMIFKYENFCNNPIQEMKKICGHIGINYSDLFLNYADFKNVTGDIDLPGHSRGIERGEIGLLPRRESFTLFLDEINSKTKANKINQILKY